MKIVVTLLMLVVFSTTCAVGTWSSGPSHCLAVPQPTQVTFNSLLKDNSLVNKFLKFHVNMPTSGDHTLKVYVQCQGSSSVVEIGKDNVPYILTHDGSGFSGDRCLELPNHISSSGVSPCDHYRIFFGGIGQSNQQCVTNIGFLPANQPCAVVHND